MKLQRQIAMKHSGRTYYKFVVILPPEAVEKAGWKEGIELRADAKNGKITLQPD